MECKNCNTELTGEYQTKFCSISCAATYNNRRRIKLFSKCLYCNSKIKNRGKFCDTQCQANWRWENIDRPRVISGSGAPRTIRRYLIETVGNKCAICDISAEWQGAPLTLQLDHIDGDSDNNVTTNVRLLCPNCHTQTETWGAKGKGSRYKKHTKRNVYLREYKNT